MPPRLARTAAAFVCPHLIDGAAPLRTAHVQARDEFGGCMDLLCGQDEDVQPRRLSIVETARLVPELRRDKLILLGVPPYVVWRDDADGTWLVECKEGWTPWKIKDGATFQWTEFRRWAKHVQQQWQDQHITDIIRTHGWKLVWVGATQNVPAFAYSIGMHLSLGAPEVLLLGVKYEHAGAILNGLGDRVRAQGPLPLGQPIQDVVEDYPVMLMPADPALARRYACWTYGYYARVLRRPPPPVVQLVWPNEAGLWPWQAPSPVQPVLLHEAPRGLA